MENMKKGFYPILYWWGLMLIGRWIDRQPVVRSLHNKRISELPENVRYEKQLCSEYMGAFVRGNKPLLLLNEAKRFGFNIRKSLAKHQPPHVLKCGSMLSEASYGIYGICIDGEEKAYIVCRPNSSQISDNFGVTELTPESFKQYYLRAIGYKQVDQIN
jgi:hypothetical protein